MGSGSTRLAHGWALVRKPGVSEDLVCEFIRAAVRAVPASMARRLGSCRISLWGEMESGVASRWILTDGGLEISVSTADCEEHDVAMELLTCLGQALWEKMGDEQLRAYWVLLNDEIGMGIEGEIDEQALKEKRALLESRSNANDLRRLAQYGRTSFAGTAAEYVHSLWHEVTVRAGPDYLTAARLRRRLELFAHWFQPDRGFRLFPAAPSGDRGTSASSGRRQSARTSRRSEGRT